MAWYYGKFSCGCEGRTNVVGKSSNRQWIADQRFEERCENCKAKARAEKVERLKAEQKELELPELTGSDAQIDWAIQIRDAAMSKIEDKLFLQDLLNLKTSAAWWIDNRFTNLDILKEKLEIEKELEEARKIEKEIELDITIYPENKVSNRPIKIKIIENKIELHFEKNDKFRQLVKENYYSWDYDKYCWYREINKFRGTIEDRAAEIGNKLLSCGFPIVIQDPEIRQKAIDGDYKHEQKLWVTFKPKENCFNIIWRTGDWYSKARSLPGSRWSKPNVLVPVCHYKAIVDFSETYNFKLSDGALEAITTEKEKEEAQFFTQVKEKAIEEPKDKEISFDILDDLKD